MRLSEKEVGIIRSFLYEADPDGKIYLFGSRADDTRHGGDIDVFFETSTSMSLRRKLSLQYKISAQSDTQVDLLFKSPGDQEKPIYELARRGVVL